MCNHCSCGGNCSCKPALNTYDVKIKSKDKYHPFVRTVTAQARTKEAAEGLVLHDNKGYELVTD